MPDVFKSFFIGGFECSSHRRRDGVRLDLVQSTGHGRWPEEDFAALAGCGMRTVRDGLRWHLIETRPGHYDWSSFLPVLRAAQRQGTQVIWDLCHYGYPDGLDIWRPEFVERFARFASAAAQLINEEGDGTPFYSPINEISFWSWAGGDVGYFNPGSERRGMELKHQLVRASIAAIEAIRAVQPSARFVQADPLIHVIPGSRRSDEVEAAENYRLAQFEAWDLLCGRQWPGLGGRPEYLDLLGANFYPHNQWVYNGPRIMRGESNYRPLCGMLRELYARYKRPILISETGAENEHRVPWLRYVNEQVMAALVGGVPMQGVCWYPILDYPGWDDGRYCPAGLFGYADGEGRRAPFHPLQAQLRHGIDQFDAVSPAMADSSGGL
ncbi:glycosyl hydrolase family protein [Pseudomonas sp. v388]|uniref:family 1 glycosylhydrolase n=1 Tax=Pseudomonas sp. v388 TaxID=2479849 RepID=UPI000F7B61E6|nr:family 1 glycosylhydrolase [Pseudomonas sp. v388]RRV10605.1 glycosyl hydrolase family protein [Pseudomonas sp. v388]